MRASSCVNAWRKSARAHACRLHCRAQAPAENVPSGTLLTDSLYFAHWLYPPGPGTDFAGAGRYRPLRMSHMLEPVPARAQLEGRGAHHTCLHMAWLALQPHVSAAGSTSRAHANYEVCLKMRWRSHSVCCVVVLLWAGGWVSGLRKLPCRRTWRTYHPGSAAPRCGAPQ